MSTPSSSLPSNHYPIPLNVSDAFSVRGHCVIVTGASGNIGSRIAEAFAANGARVICSDRPDSRLQEIVTRLVAEGYDVLGIPADLCRPEDLRTLVDAAKLRFGRVDDLINCGGVPGSKPLHMETDEEFDRLYHTNVRSIWMLIRYLIDSQLFPEGGASIVNIASINAHRATSMFSLYAGTKSAVLAMTRELAVELAPKRIRINSVSPGLIANMNHYKWLHDMLIDSAFERIYDRFQKRIDAYGYNYQPLPVGGHAIDIAMACLYLCTPAARFITSTDLVVDGGKLNEMPDAEPRITQRRDEQNFWRELRETLALEPDESFKGERPEWMKKLRETLLEEQEQERQKVLQLQK